MFIPSEVSLGIYTRTVLLPLSKKEKQVKFIKKPIIIKGLGPSCQKGLKKNGPNNKERESYCRRLTVGKLSKEELCPVKCPLYIMLMYESTARLVLFCHQSEMVQF